jgi:hypothetical protein
MADKSNKGLALHGMLHAYHNQATKPVLQGAEL